MPWDRLPALEVDLEIEGVRLTAGLKMFGRWAELIFGSRS